MKLSKRLQAITEFIPENSNVIDVGCDHALVSIYLNKYKNCQVLGTDISKNCIEKAKENIKKYNANIKVKVTNGLENIELDNQIIIIAGMGAHTILKILNKKITNDLVICSHNDIPLLRKKMYQKGYHIVKEKVIFDKHYYIITYYKFGKGKKINYHVSPFIKDDNYLKYLLEKYSLKHKYEKNIFLKLEYKNIIKKIKRSL